MFRFCLGFEAGAEIALCATFADHNYFPTGCQLIGLFGMTVQKGMCDLVDRRAYRLYLAHAGADGNAPILVVVIPVHAGHILQEDRHRRTALHSLHEDLIILHAAGKIGGKLRQRLALRLAHIKNCDRLVHRNLNFLFFHDGLAVSIQHGELGVRVEFCFLDFLFVRRRGNDLDAFFALEHITPELIAPLVETGNDGGVRLLHIDEHGIIDAVLVEPAHGAKIILVLFAFKQLFNTIFNAVGDLFEPVLVRLLFCHIRSFPGLQSLHVISPCGDVEILAGA